METVDEELLCGYATAKSYLFIYFCLFYFLIGEIATLIVTVKHLQRLIFF